MELEMYLDKTVCEACNGDCCKSLPGATLPSDFGTPLLANLKKAFASGKWSVDWWEGDPTDEDIVDKGFYVRPSVKGDLSMYHDSWGGECVFFVDGSGCDLSDEERPTGCQLLQPRSSSTDGKCIIHGASKQESAIAWLPFHDIIHKATGRSK